MPKRVLIFSLAYYPFVGGAEVAIKEITDRISADAIQFDMVTLRFDNSLPRFERIGNVNVHRIGFTSTKPTMADLVQKPLVFNKYLLPLIGWWKASQLHRNNQYEATWSMMANYAGFAAVLFKITHPRVPFLLTLQEGDPIDYIKNRVRFVYPLFRRIFTKADIIQAISNYLANFARDMGFAGPLEVIPNAVDTKHFSHSGSADELNALREQFGKKNDDAYLITTSRLVQKNAVDDVIRSLIHLPSNVYFLILGIGPDEAKLKGLAEELHVTSRVKFLGQIAHSDMPKYLHISDIFIRPSLSEGMGNSFIEAMAAGIPVIATPVGGIVDFLFDPEKNQRENATGLFCTVRDAESIARCVQRLLDDAVLRERIIKNARKLAFEKYDWDLIARSMKDRVFAKLSITSH